MGRYPNHAGFSSYEASRQFADARAVSRLSPYLHFGQLRHAGFEMTCQHLLHICYITLKYCYKYN